MQNAGEIRFGRYCLLPRERRLLGDGIPIELGARAIEVLRVLVDAKGAIVSKDELLSRVWPDTIVEENNLTFQIHALRKALGADRELIRTIPRGGYFFAGNIESRSDTDLVATAPVARTNVVAPANALIGRDDEVQELLDLQANCRLLTLTGPGGSARRGWHLSWRGASSPRSQMVSGSWSWQR